MQPSDNPYTFLCLLCKKKKQIARFAFDKTLRKRSEACMSCEHKAKVEREKKAYIRETKQKYKERFGMELDHNCTRCNKKDLSEFLSRLEHGELHLNKFQCFRCLHDSDTTQLQGVYFVRSTDLGYVKIGYSSDVAKRFVDLQHTSASPLELLAVYPHEGREKEQELHKLFSYLHVHSEWFEIDASMITYIKQNCRVFRHLQGKETKSGG